MHEAVETTGEKDIFFCFPGSVLPHTTKNE